MTVVEYNQALKMISKLISETNLKEEERIVLESNLDAIDNYFSLEFDTKHEQN